MSTKRQRALKEYKGHNGTATLSHVERNITNVYPKAWSDLTGVQYGQLMNVANTSFHDGKASAGAWAECGLIGNKEICLPIDLLKKIKKVERKEETYTKIIPSKGNTPFSHVFQGTKFYRKLEDGSFRQVTSKDVPGTENWNDWQRAQELLPEQLYSKEVTVTIDYFIGDILIYSE